MPSGNEANEDFGGAMLFRIPAMSLGALDRYCRDLERMNVDISQVVTRLGFVPSMAYPSITFEPAGWVQSAEAYAIVVDHVQSEAVNRIINESGLEPAPTIEQPSPGMAALTAQPRPTFAPMQAQQPPPPPPVQQAQAPAPAPSPFRQAAPQSAPAAPEPEAAPPPAPAPVAPARARAPARAATPAQPAQPARPAAPAPTNGAGPVVTGAPEDLSNVIDGLLSN